MQSIKQTQSNEIRIGRFAPSPTGSLHFGSLIAAVASYLCARQHPDSRWFLRIEDVDTERRKKGATSSIINALEAYGFCWDGEIIYQSKRTELYQDALDQLGLAAYPCSCTRKDLIALSSEMTYGYIYPGLCKNGILNTDVKNPSIRVATNDNEICFQDECQPQLFCQNIQKEIGDFILKRRDGLFAYQLAVVVDDHLQGINQVVRGADLFDNTPRQIYLQNLLGYATPDYLHFPVAVSENGKKLSKQNMSPEITLDKKQVMLIQALRFLGQQTPEASEFSSIPELWQWALQNWDSSNIPPKMESLLHLEIN